MMKLDFNECVVTMNKIAIISLSALLLAACSSSNYDSEVKTESYQEAYKTDEVAQPITDASAAPMEQDVKDEPSMIEASTDSNKKVVKLSPAAEKNQQATSESSVRVFYPEDKNKSAQQPDSNNYVVQVAALNAEDRVLKMADQLPDNQPKWENVKTINGKQWHSLLFGDFKTKDEAKDAVLRLSVDLQAMEPFVKSVKSIQNSQYPTLKKLP
ncbi:SPOR domain-containing protein [Vibrio sp. S17_S38]|uniref:SPOR domain-containing protein n=1 Tax=Vibrio sp. S17_S38 TaxID=2720229 RepID=UPI0016813535|nr:SPOR domain-containing protein [Vibrio sp. S17_S38]MBD1574766.1 SPOR domain-containing protein [Vibrio sp. S17_S38]